MDQPVRRAFAVLPEDVSPQFRRVARQEVGRLVDLYERWVEAALNAAFAAARADDRESFREMAVTYLQAEADAQGYRDILARLAAS